MQANLHAMGIDQQANSPGDGDPQACVDAVAAAIHERRSIRRYLDQPVPREMLERILDAAHWAPSSHNRQPWRFAVLTEKSSRVALADAMGARLRRDLQRDGVPADVIERDVLRSYERLTGAPVCVVLCLSMQDMDVYNDPVRDRNEYLMAVQSTAMAGQNMLLLAHVLGLGACWMCAPLFCPEVVVDVLQLDTHWMPQGMVTLGYFDQGRSRNRDNIESRIVWR
jgi:coenzyme F420-0:L-glutamate ligase / coenzyme F420-1:gamma-L-glutamate ligase